MKTIEEVLKKLDEIISWAKENQSPQAILHARTEL